MDITMDFWRDNVDKILEFQDKKILTHPGSISKITMENKVKNIYSQFDRKRKAYDALIADNDDMKELKQLEQNIKQNRDDK